MERYMLGHVTLCHFCPPPFAPSHESQSTSQNNQLLHGKRAICHVIFWRKYCRPSLFWYSIEPLDISNSTPKRDNRNCRVQQSPHHDHRRHSHHGSVDFFWRFEKQVAAWMLYILLWSTWRSSKFVQAKTERLFSDFLNWFLLYRGGGCDSF